jgi:hypothetical protein
MALEYREVEPGRLRVKISTGEEFWLKQTGDGQRLEISSMGRPSLGSFAVQPRLSNVIEIGRVK